MPAVKVHKILSDFNQIQRFTKSYVNEIKYYGQHSPGTSKPTSLFQRRKTAVVLANPVVRWKNKKHKAKPKSKSRKRRIKYTKGEAKKTLCFTQVPAAARHDQYNYKSIL